MPACMPQDRDRVQDVANDQRTYFDVKMDNGPDVEGMNPANCVQSYILAPRYYHAKITTDAACKPAGSTLPLWC